MSLSFSVLGSGSSGNSTVVCLNGAQQPRYMLIDAGLTPRATRKRLGPLGLTLDDISDIFLTHLDRDHFCPTWANAAKKHDILLHAHHRQQSRLRDLDSDLSRMNLFRDEVELSSETTMQCIPLAHDQLGTVGFVLDHSGTRLGFATDLGRVPAMLLERCTALHALAIESNYDRTMQLQSARPARLKRRIMGGRGHLSNEQALEAVCHIAGRSALAHIALLHLSRQCNCPRLLTSLYAQRAKHLLSKVTVTNQCQSTPLLHVTPRPVDDRYAPVRPAQQLSLF